MLETMNFVGLRVDVREKDGSTSSDLGNWKDGLINNTMAAEQFLMAQYNRLIQNLGSVTHNVILNKLLNIFCASVFFSIKRS